MLACICSWSMLPPATGMTMPGGGYAPPNPTCFRIVRIVQVDAAAGIAVAEKRGKMMTDVHISGVDR
eukprot:2655420-Rhodomonas_salina.2